MESCSWEGNDEEDESRLGEEEVTDQSFRQSFYTSGTDWSRLYEVDDYGVPVISGTNEEQEEAPRSGSNTKGQSLGLTTDSRARGFLNSEVPAQFNSGLSKRGPVTNLKSPRSGAEDFDSGGKFSGSRRLVKQETDRSVSKLVQSDLSSFLGIKRKPAAHENSSSKKYRQLDVGTLLGISPPIKNRSKEASEFLGKFTRVSKPIDPQGEEDGQRRNFGGFQGGGDQMPRKCPFYKKIPGTAFTVDAFRYGEVEGCRAYFLTHFHADHYGGLTKRWCHGPIYCTPTTARLVVMCLGVGPQWIIPLELGVTHLIEGLQIRMLEANHCPGAALILFRFQSGNQVLHTGDFRACKDMQAYPELLSGSIKTLYLDTTYCNERYRFPLQKEVIDFVIKQTSMALSRNPKTLVVVGSYSIGKERVYVSMAEVLGIPIFADSHRRRLLKALEWPALTTRLSTDPASTLLHVLPLSNLNPQRLKAYLQSHHPKYTAILAFRPTGWTYSDKLGDKLQFLKPKSSGPVTIYGVPYSEHSSFTELRDFVQFLRPLKIIPTVNNAKEEQRERMKAHFSKWLVC